MFYYSTILCCSQLTAYIPYMEKRFMKSLQKFSFCVFSACFFCTENSDMVRKGLRLEHVLIASWKGTSRDTGNLWNYSSNDFTMFFLNIIQEQTITLTRGHTKVRSIHFYWQDWYFAKFIQIWLDKLVVSNGNTVWY